MTPKVKIRAIALGLMVTAAVGCGSEFPVANVSGMVTLDGEALQNATMFFQPKRRGENPIVGPPSIGVTDDSGRFTLITSQGDSGAVVGTHTVSISTYESRMVDPKKSDRMEVVSKERIPQRYRAPSELTFTVPAGGAGDADFSLTTQ